MELHHVDSGKERQLLSELCPHAQQLLGKLESLDDDLIVIAHSTIGDLLGHIAGQIVCPSRNPVARWRAVLQDTDQFFAEQLKS